MYIMRSALNNFRGEVDSFIGKITDLNRCDDVNVSVVKERFENIQMLEEVINGMNGIAETCRQILLATKSASCLSFWAT